MVTVRECSRGAASASAIPIVFQSLLLRSRSSVARFRTTSRPRSRMTSRPTRRGLRGDAVASERPSRGQRPGASALLGGAGGTEADRAGQPGAAEPAVPEGILREVLLVIVLSEVELRGVQDLGGDAAVAGAVQHALVGVTRRLGEPALLG